MTPDVEQTNKSLAAIIDTQMVSPSNEQKMVFGHLHLSPLKVIQHESKSLTYTSLDSSF